MSALHIAIITLVILVPIALIALLVYYFIHTRSARTSVDSVVSEPNVYAEVSTADFDAFEDDHGTE
ncbi:MAG: hypothetical protein HGA54_00815 [Actinobacteria bacterium]|nr:hypothetical protein [Actinomycetota bacterium]